MTPSRDRFIHRVDVLLRDTERRDRTGSLAVNATPIRADVPCFVADKGGGRTMAFSSDLVSKHVRVLFPDRIELGPEHRLTFLDNGQTRTLLVDSLRDDSGLGVVFVAECTEIPRPVTTPAPR